MIRRVLFILLAAILLLASSPVAYADVVMGNDFRYQHEKETQKLDRSRFCANGPDGYVIPQQEPGGTEEVFTFERPWVGDSLEVVLPKYQNGAELLMERMYILEGEFWGVMYPSHSYSWPGWIPMEHLLVVYIRDDFNKEYHDEFYTYTGGYDTVLSAERLVLWQWPGSDREKRVIDDESFLIKDISADYAYIDEQGREWGYVNIRYTYTYWTDGWTQDMQTWICLDDPSNSKIPSFIPAPKPVEWSPDGVYEWIHFDATDDGVEQFSLSNITKIREYETNKTFSDITENAWYNDAVAIAYEYGIIQGKGSNKFDPYGHLTGGEALTIASRIHAYYKYGEAEGSRLLNLYNLPYVGGIGWLLGTIEYCQLEGLIRGDEFEDYYYSPITRAQMVHLWSKILEPKDITKRNTVGKLPDVNAETAFSEDIILFYEAGIIGGVDAQGTFNPSSKITRAEAATIFMNLIDVSKRHDGRTYGSATS